MKIEATNYDIKVFIERPDDITINELLDMFKTITIGITYSEVQWKQAIIDLADEYQKDVEIAE